MNANASLNPNANAMRTHKRNPSLCLHSPQSSACCLTACVNVCVSAYAHMSLWRVLVLIHVCEWIYYVCMSVKSQSSKTKQQQQQESQQSLGKKTPKKKNYSSSVPLFRHVTNRCCIRSCWVPEFSTDVANDEIVRWDTGHTTHCYVDCAANKGTLPFMCSFCCC